FPEDAAVPRRPAPRHPAAPLAQARRGQRGDRPDPPRQAPGRPRGRRRAARGRPGTRAPGRIDRPAATVDAPGTYRGMAARDGGLVAPRTGTTLWPQRELVEIDRLARPVAAADRTGRTRPR